MQEICVVRLKTLTNRRTIQWSMIVTKVTMGNYDRLSLSPLERNFQRIMG